MVLSSDLVPPCLKLTAKWIYAMMPTLRGRLICTSLCTFFANSAKILSIFCAFAINSTIKIWRFKNKFLTLPTENEEEV